MERLELEAGDLIDISHTDTQIIVGPHRETYVCAITGKVSKEAVKIWEVWIIRKVLKS